MLRFVASKLKYRTKSLRIKGRGFKAYIADSFIKQVVGLMYRKGLGKNECMLFVFPTDAEHGIWMMNMNFPIDAIWLNKDMVVTHIERNIRPCKKFSGCKTYGDEDVSRFLVECAAGTSSRLKIEIGDNISS